MEEQLKKLKTKSITALILALLAITWQFLNYITIKKYMTLDDFTSFEVIIVYSSYIFLAIFFIAFLSLTFSVFRASIKYHSEKRKEEKQKAITTSQNKTPDALEE
jgi:cbb3-type cytochrome oxidase subunit 3